MNKIKSGLLVLTTLFLSNTMKAQTIEEGKKFMYYERYQSAKGVFQKLLAATPNNPEAVYWLGMATLSQGEFAPKELNETKELYRKALEANANSPLLIAGMGNVELLEGKSQDARSRFETALSLSQNKDLDVLTAVGRANSNFDNKNGDANYAIEKLKLATGLKKFKDPAVHVYMGDAYRMLMDGGNAQIAYQSALNIDPNYARALYRIGKIYQTQGVGQEEIYMKYYNEAIAKDAAYGPVYKNLSDLYYNTDVTKSAAYLDTYLTNTDDDPKNCYYRASMKYAQALFAEAISLAEKCIAGNPNPYPKLYGIEGYAYNRLGDSVKAKAAFESYFQKGDTSQIGMGDYATYASVLLKFPGNDTLAGKYVDKAVELDTLEANKLTYLTNIASYYVMQKNYKEAADWYSKILKVRKDTRKTDLFNAGNNYAKAKEFPAAIEVFDQYIQKFPNESMGYYMNARNYLNIDSTDAEGKGLAYYNKIVDMADSIKDKPGEKERIKYSLQYLIEYSANVKKDKAASLAYVDRGLALDSTDAEFKNMREVISNANFSAPRNQSPKQDKPATPKAGSKPSAEKPNATKQPADSGNK